MCNPLYFQIVLILGLTAACYPVLVQGDDRHSLAFEWQSGQEIVSGVNRSTEIEPLVLNLHYAYRINQQWSIAVSGWRGGDEKSWNETWFLVNETEGTGTTLSYSQDSWWLDFSINGGSTENLLQQKHADRHYAEKNDTLELSVYYNYDLEWHSWWITPSVGFGYQQNQLETRTRNITNLATGGWRISASESQEQEGGFLSGQLSVAYPFSISEEALFLQTLSFAWLKPFSGSARSSFSIVGTKNTTVRSLTTTQNQNSDSESSGFVNVAFSVLINHYSADLSVSKPIDNDVLGTQTSLRLAVSF